ncbi:rhomboid family intramembrane serine protease [Candidatus Viadribacter manganicus]|uniref:rhomboid family intramembrane serine protease n=1 Tax=Candidatus Viadribacter manganicus TaxID=1759059 RepID=UPI0012EA53C9|nr:rhomboid family intramembrane serine protease [Candidatus Viadribacter manganicus]
MNDTSRPPTPIAVWLLTGFTVAAYAAFTLAPVGAQNAVDYAFALIPERFHAGSEYRFEHWYETFGPIFGHAFLHTGWMHLAVNAFFLFGASRLPALRLGAVRYLVVYFWAVAVSALTFLALNWNEQSSAVGASGGVCGMITAFFLSLRPTWREALADPRVRGPLAVLFFLNVVVLGVLAEAGIVQISWEGHLGGFIGGGVAYTLLQRPAPLKPA